MSSSNRWMTEIGDGRGRRRVLRLNRSKYLTKALLVEILRILQVSSVTLGWSHPDQKTRLESLAAPTSQSTSSGEIKGIVYERVLGDSPT